MVDVLDPPGVAAPVLGLLEASLPFPVRVSPRAAALETHLRAWARRHGLVRTEAAGRRFDAAGFGYFAGCVYPMSPDPVLAAEWVAWLFLFDDQFDDGPAGRRPDRIGAVLTDLLAVLPLDAGRVSVPSGHPAGGLADALADLWRRTAPMMSPDWRRRFVRHVAAYLDSYRQEAANRHLGVPPGLVEYVALRRSTGAAETCLDMIEVAAGFSLPTAVADGPGYRTLALAANDIICWTNDIVSIGKELARGEVNNLVAVLRNAGAPTWPAAQREAIALVAGRWRDFLAAADALPTRGLGPSTHFRQDYCVTAMKQWIAGSLHWHRGSARYREVQHTAAGQWPAYLDDLVRLPAN